MPLKHIQLHVILGWIFFAASTAPAQPPNILFISLDTTRADHCSVYGYERDTTPNLEALARNGVLFERAYAPTATTGPSHATMFTSLYPITHGVVKNGLVLAPEFNTLAENLKAAGYHTAAVISSFALDGRFGYEQGFEDYLDEMQPSGASVSSGEWHGFRVEHGFDRRANVTTNESIRWLRHDRDAQRPFFLFVHYFEPHDPYVPPEPYRSRYPINAPYGETENDITLYDASIRFTDAEVGRLLRYMKNHALLKDTLVVVVGDHGEGLMDHDRMYHGNDVFEESVRVPLIFWHASRLSSGRRIAEPVELTDLLPTLNAIAGISTSAEPAGFNQLSMMQGASRPSPDRAVYLHRRHYSANDPSNTKGLKGERFGVLHRNWKFVTGEEGSDPELYHLNTDPSEQDNIAADHPEKAAELQALLHTWLDENMRDDTSVPALPAEDREALEAIGYIE